MHIHSRSRLRTAAMIFGLVFAALVPATTRAQDASPGSQPAGILHQPVTAQGEAPAHPSDAQPAATTPTTVSLRIAGSALKPRESNVEWTGAGGGGGCIYASSGTTNAVFNTPLILPQGSTVEYVRMYYNDSNATVDSRAWFTVYNLYGDLVNEWLVTSSGSSGYGYSTTDEINHTVDYDSYSYVLNWRPNSLGSDNQLCGFRIYYTPPAGSSGTVLFPIVVPR